MLRSHGCQSGRNLSKSAERPVIQRLVGQWRRSWCEGWVGRINEIKAGLHGDTYRERV